MSVKILVQKELTVDLNAYYENFPRKLKEEILDHITSTLSTDKKGFTRANGREWRREGDGFPLTYPSRSFRIGEPPTRGQLRALHSTLRAKYGDRDITVSELKESLEAQGVEKPSTIISNLWRCKALLANRVN